MYEIKNRKSRLRIHSVFSESLESANLNEVDLRDADLRQANLRFADLSGARLEGADMTGANLDGARLAGAKYNGSTIWPAGFNPKSNGAVNAEKALDPGAMPTPFHSGEISGPPTPPPGQQKFASSSFYQASRFEGAGPKPNRPKPPEGPPRKPALAPSEGKPKEAAEKPAEVAKDYWAPEIIHGTGPETKPPLILKPSADYQGEPVAPIALPHAAEAAPRQIPETRPSDSQPPSRPASDSHPPQPRLPSDSHPPQPRLTDSWPPAPAYSVPTVALQAQPAEKVADRKMLVAIAAMVGVFALFVVAVLAIFTRNAPRSGAPGGAQAAGNVQADAGATPGDSPVASPGEPGAGDAESSSQPPPKPAIAAAAAPANQPPVVERVAFDPDGMESGGPLSFEVAASDPEGDSVASYFYWLDGQTDAARTENPKIELSNLRAGDRKLYVVAMDGRDARSEPFEVAFSVMPKGKKSKANVAPQLTASPAPEIEATPAASPAPRFASYTESHGGLEIEMVWIPGGEFAMGSPPSEKGRDSDEGPRHKVVLSGFWLGKFEVTQQQHYKFTTSLEKNRVARKPVKYKGSDRFPQQNVSWEEAHKFCERLAEATGKKYCLPTEAQWEYACRAGTETAYHTGETITSNQANFNERTMFSRKGVYREQPVDVGSFRANKFGLFDMHGNVWEWCSDWHEGDFASRPPGIENPKGPSGGRAHVIRGGGAHDGAGELRSANRRAGNADILFGSNGFRIARNPG